MTKENLIERSFARLKDLAEDILDIDLPGEFDRSRANQAFLIRLRAALESRKRFPTKDFATNGDEQRYPNKIANFTKGLPHNELGEVDLDAYNALLKALETGELSDANAIPIGGNLKLLNPLGGLAFNLERPDSAAVGLVEPPPAFASPEMAAQAVEVGYQAVLRDVPFTDFETNSVIQEAAENLSNLSGYRGPLDSATGTVTPEVIFRYDYPGALEGPFVSQFLLQPFIYDGISVEPRIRTRLPVLNWQLNGSFQFNDGGEDFLTLYEEWLAAQNGFPEAVPGEGPFDPTPRYPRSMRDLGQIAASDFIYSAYFRAARIFPFFNNDVLDENNPYKNSQNQNGFSTFGIADLVLLIGSVHKAERHAWYQKWLVHRYQRPEEFWGRVENHLQGRAEYPIPEELLNSPVLGRIEAYNRELNKRRFGEDRGSFLLPQELPVGCPTHPSAPAGHAISAGACVTILKAWFDEDFVLSSELGLGPKQPNRDGTALEDYEGSTLTIGGELNKLAHNLSAGRDMSGVHWRVADDFTGNLQGEELAILILKEAKATYPERFKGFSLTKFDGTKIVI